MALSIGEHIQIPSAEAQEDREERGLRRMISKGSVGLTLPALAKLAALPSLYFLMIKAINAHKWRSLKMLQSVKKE